ncbi:hypothetical protein CYMTET_34478, partial [Cymbomonas tetramitiformis]
MLKPQGLALLLATFIEGIWAAYDFKVVNPVSSCADDEFFDISGLECVACQSTEVVNDDGLSCVCPLGWIRGSTTTVGEYPFCISCLDADLASSSDRTRCLACGFGSTLDKTVGECVCTNADAVLIEHDVVGMYLDSKECYTCPTNSWKSTTDASKCEECPMVEGTIPAVSMEYNAATQKCVCPASLADGISCVAESSWETELEQQLGVNFATKSEITYYDVGDERTSIDVESWWLEENLVEATWNCTKYHDREACNSIANMCVLQMYDPSSVACAAYQELHDLRRDQEYHASEIEPAVGWSYTLPWLYYTGGTLAYTEALDVETQVSFTEHEYAQAKVSHMVVVLSIYTLNGTWLGFHNLTREFQLCDGAFKHTNDWQRFGRNYDNQCKLTVTELTEAVRQAGHQNDLAEPLFYDLYLQDLQGAATTNWPERLYPIPIYNVNL